MHKKSFFFPFVHCSCYSLVLFHSLFEVLFFFSFVIEESDWVLPQLVFVATTRYTFVVPEQQFGEQTGTTVRTKGMPVPSNDSFLRKQLQPFFKSCKHLDA
jgi:hypothetical protein